MHYIKTRSNDWIKTRSPDLLSPQVIAIETNTEDPRAVRVLWRYGAGRTWAIYLGDLRGMLEVDPVLVMSLVGGMGPWVSGRSAAGMAKRRGGWADMGTSPAAAAAAAATGVIVTVTNPPPPNFLPKNPPPRPPPYRPPPQHGFLRTGGPQRF